MRDTILRGGGRPRIAAAILTLFLAGSQSGCLDAYECQSGEILCDLESYLAVYSLVAGCSTNSFSTYQGGAGADRIKHLIQTANFGYVAVGSSDQSFGSPLNAHSGGNDLWISRYDRAGNLLWHSFYGSAGNDSAEHVLELADGSLMISGFAAGSFGSPINPFAGGSDMALVKLDANGALIWNTFFGAAGADGGGVAILRPDGLMWYLGVASGLLTGNVGTALSAYTGGATMGAAILIDSNGAPSLYGLLGPPGGVAEFRSGAATSTGIIIGGQASANFGTPVNAHSGLGDDWYVQALTNEASPQLGFSTFFGAGGADVSQDTVVLSSNEILTVGRSLNPTGTPINAHSGSADIAFVKLDALGNRVFHTYLGQAGVDRAFGATELADGSLVAGGHSDAAWGSPLKPYIGGIDFALVRLTSTGTLASHSFYGSTGTDQAFALRGTCDGGVVLAGGATGELSGLSAPVQAHSVGTEDAAILKLAPGEF